MPGDCSIPEHMFRGLHKKNGPWIALLTEKVRADGTAGAGGNARHRNAHGCCT